MIFRKQQNQDKKNRQDGFILAEVLVSSGILIVAAAGILISYLRCLELHEFSRNAAIAIQSAQSRMELVRSEDFASMKATYDGVSFSINDLNGMGVSYVNDSITDLLAITVSVSWQQKNGRVFGEDNNLNGQWDAGEDTISSNGMLDSPVQLENYFFQR
ncbi:MAG: type II secretion system protein [Candidatus Omnitrophica bacterium]|nr:type II secretion system protein [Candidatus Omnitrophota bacterium]